MPSSVLPLLITAGSFIAAIVSVYWFESGQRKLAVKWLLGAFCGLLGPPILSLLIAAVLWCGCKAGLIRLQLLYSQWLESTPDIVASVSLIPMSFRRVESLYWLEQAASAKNVEAMYALGHKLKRGICVPEGAEDPIRGQQFINDAIESGYKEEVPENEYYSRRFLIHSPLP